MHPHVLLGNRLSVTVLRFDILLQVTGVVTRRQSQEAERAAAAAAAAVEDVHQVVDVTQDKHDEGNASAAESDNAVHNTRSKKPVAGFTRTLVAKSETGAHSLARRTEQLQLQGQDVLVVDDDIEVRSFTSARCEYGQAFSCQSAVCANRHCQCPRHTALHPQASPPCMLLMLRVCDKAPLCSPLVYSRSYALTDQHKVCRMLSCPVQQLSMRFNAHSMPQRLCR